MNSDDDLPQFDFIWNSPQEWGLLAHHHSEVVLTAIFPGESPTVADLAALRRLRPELRDVPAHELKARFEGAREVELGCFSALEAREIEARAGQLEVPFEIRSQGHSFEDYSAIARDGSHFLLIEDEELGQRVTRRMLAMGIPVVQTLESD